MFLFELEHIQTPVTLSPFLLKVKSNIPSTPEFGFLDKRFLDNDNYGCCCCWGSGERGLTSRPLGEMIEMRFGSTGLRKEDKNGVVPSGPHPRGQVRWVYGAVEEAGHRVVGFVAVMACRVVWPTYRMPVSLDQKQKRNRDWAVLKFRAAVVRLDPVVEEWPYHFVGFLRPDDLLNHPAL